MSQAESTWFQAILTQLELHTTVARSADGLVPADADMDIDDFGIACPECGQYLGCHRHLQSHRARQHGYKGNSASVTTAAQYAANSIGGMPTCVHRLNQFTRVEGLKKHINSGCEAVLRKQRRAETAAEGTGQVPDTRVELPIGAGLHRQSLQRRATL